VTVTDILPPGTTFVSATPTQGSCSSFTSAITCSLGAVANGGSATIVLVVTAPNSSGPLANTATVVSTTPDPNTANDSSTWTVTLGTASVPALSTWSLGLLALLLAASSMRFVLKTHLPS
jgi:hypothetical protein